MSHTVSSKSAAAYLIDPMNAPEPAHETGPGAHFQSTYASAPANRTSTPDSPLSSKNPYRNSGSPKPSAVDKSGASARVRSGSGSPKEAFPRYRAEAFGDPEPPRRRAGSHSATPPSYTEAIADGFTPGHRRRGSSLKERYPGDKSHEPLETIRKDSKKAFRSPHLRKSHIPGTDSIDRLDPAIGGRSYHHEGPFDAALGSRNSNPKYAPIQALKTSNEEALKATPLENIKDAVERHRPLDGVAAVPSGQADRFGRTYNYEEGADLMLEGSSDDPGYKRWDGKDYDPEDLKGESEPMFSLDRALKTHKIDDNGIEMEGRPMINKDYHNAERKGTLDSRDPVEIAGDETRYAQMQAANTPSVGSSTTGSGGLGGLKKRIGSIRRRKQDD